MQPLETVEAVLRFFRENQAPIFFVNSRPYNLLNLANFISCLEFVTFTNTFDGRHAGVFVPAALPSECPGRVEAVNNLLLGHPEVAELVRDRGGKALFLMFDEETERLAGALGLEVGFPPAALRHRLDSEVGTTRLAAAAGVASVPHVLARVGSYRRLREVARDLGPDLVVQLPHGDFGHTTFFISSGADGFVAFCPAEGFWGRLKVYCWPTPWTVKSGSACD